jgi:hypothetical protein
MAPLYIKIMIGIAADLAARFLCEIIFTINVLYLLIASHLRFSYIRYITKLLPLINVYLNLQEVLCGVT